MNIEKRYVLLLGHRDSQPLIKKTITRISFLNPESYSARPRLLSPEGKRRLATQRRRGNVCEMVLPWPVKARVPELDISAGRGMALVF
jgi:hypothetical protein